jgi:hypothetical protein
VLPLFAAIVTVCCVWASLRRLRTAIAPTSIDPAPILEALRGEEGRARFDDVCAALADAPDAEWERELVHAFERTGTERTARINELLLDLDYAVSSGARVPRVCASIAASTGFLLASLALRQGLGVVGDLPFEVQDFIIHQAVKDGIDVAAIGICGAILCITIGHRAAKAAKARLALTDQLVERLESLAPAASSADEGVAISASSTPP